MKYKLEIVEYIKAIQGRTPVSYEVNAKNKAEAVRKLSKHVFGLSKEEIGGLI